MNKAGWATGDVFVWDRRLGVLVAYPKCSTTVTSKCVTFPVLFDSLADPRSIAFGDCGMSFMLSSTQRTLPRTGAVGTTDPAHMAGLRYTCPALQCGANGQPSGQISPDTVQGFVDMWAIATSADAGVLSTICSSPAGDLAGTIFDLQSCLDAEFDKALLASQNTPFESFASCTLDGLSGEDLPGATTTPMLSGIPMGDNCSLTENGSSTSSAAAGTTPSGPLPTTNPGPQGATKFRNPDGSYTYVYQTANGRIYMVNGQAIIVVDVPPVNGASFMFVVGDCSSCTPAEQSTNAIQFLVDLVAAAELGGVEPPDAAAHAANVLGKLRGGETLGWLTVQGQGGTVREWVPGNPSGGQNCSDPFACSDSCTALARRLKASEACTKDLLDAFATAMGRPVDQIDEGLDRVSYPHPSGYDVETDAFGACMSAPTAPRPALACGLMLCSNGDLSSEISAKCKCSTAANYTLTQLCAEFRCADDSPPPPGTCICPPPDPVEGLLPGGGPLPDPASWRSIDSTLEMCVRRDIDSGLSTYDRSFDLRLISGSNGTSWWVD